MTNYRVSKDEMNPRIREVIPTDDYKLKLVFTNGESGVYDC